MANISGTAKWRLPLALAALQDRGLPTRSFESRVGADAPTQDARCRQPGREAQFGCSGASACQPASYLSHVRGKTLSERATVELGD